MEKQHHKNCVLERKNNWHGYNILTILIRNYPLSIKKGFSDT